MGQTTEKYMEDETHRKMDTIPKTKKEKDKGSPKEREKGKTMLQETGNPTNLAVIATYQVTRHATVIDDKEMRKRNKESGVLGLRDEGHYCGDLGGVG
jgi:hypothetical protein